MSGFRLCDFAFDPIFPVEDLKLSTRSRNLLKKYEVIDIAQIVELSYALWSRQGIGRVSIDEIARTCNEKLKALGLTDRVRGGSDL